MRAWFVSRFAPALAADAEAVFAALCDVERDGDTRVAEITLAADGEPWRGHAPGTRLIVTVCACGTHSIVPIPDEVS
jgi:hypothetical protein